MYKKNDVIKILTMKPFWSDQDKLCTIIQIFGLKKGYKICC